MSLERSLHIDVEPTLLRFVHSRDWLLHGAQSFYRNLNEPVMIAFLAVARLLDPVRYPKLRTAYALLHVPALAVLALYPLAPPHWVHGVPYADGPPLHPSALRNETAAAVSLHFGGPVLLVGGLLWLRPRALLAWLTALYPVAVFVVIVGTGNHYVLDTVVGTACVGVGVAAAHAIHGPLPHGVRTTAADARGARGNRLRTACVPHQWRFHRRTPMSVRSVLSHTRHPRSLGRARAAGEPTRHEWVRELGLVLAGTARLLRSARGDR